MGGSSYSQCKQDILAESLTNTLCIYHFAGTYHSYLMLFTILLQVWWAIGSMFGALLAYGVMRPGGLGWHWYLGLAAIPLALVLFFFPVLTVSLLHAVCCLITVSKYCLQIVPESARFYVVRGENLKAEKVLRRVAFFNMREPLDVSAICILCSGDNMPCVVMLYLGVT